MPARGPHTTAGHLQFPSKNGRASPGELTPDGKLVKPGVETFDIEQGDGMVEEQRSTFARAVSFGQVTFCLAHQHSACRSTPKALWSTCSQTTTLPTLCDLHAASMLSPALVPASDGITVDLGLLRSAIHTRQLHAASMFPQ